MGEYIELSSFTNVARKERLMNIQKILEQVKNGELSIEKATEFFKSLPYEDMDFAKLDHHRRARCGFAEVVFCQGKTEEQLIAIFKSFCTQDSQVLGTRANSTQYEAVAKHIPEVTYDTTSHILKLEKFPKERKGLVAVCTGGTADMAVAEEAAQTAEFLGCEVLRVYDVGVAGIHRLLSKVEQIRKAHCIIAVAGMEGALPSVVSGLVDKPVIAVPTSIGYGASFGGLSALLTMLNSCAEGVVVVNIDNGFGAGYAATQIAYLAVN